MKIAGKIQAGIVFVNKWGLRDITVPIGGFK